MNLGLDQMQFVVSSEPVIAHPLLLTSRRSTTTMASRNNNQQQKEASGHSSSLSAAQREVDGQERGEGDREFLDPLGAASPATQTAEATNGRVSSFSPNTSGSSFRHKRQQQQQKSHHQEKVTAILNAGQLDNTLDQADQDQWPLDGLDPELLGFRPWRKLRQRILETFTTGERLSLESSFLSNLPSSIADSNEAILGGGIKMQSSQMQRQKITAATLKEKKILDKDSSSAFGVGAKNKWSCELSQQEWVRRLNELRHILLRMWAEEKRLDCIKLVAEVVALLSGNIASAQFFPAEFVHVTDLLDLFGHLVHQRLLERARQERRQAGLGPLPAQWTIHDVLGDTRLKARNWFGKINQMVRNMTQRIYMLAAILPCQRFMDPWPEAAQQNMLELCQAACQVQHPLVAAFLRCYLCRCAMRLNPADRAPHWKCLNDWLQTHAQQPMSQWLWPPMEWLVQCVAYTAVSYEDLHPLWEYCRLADMRPIVLVPMLNALPRLYLGEHALEACQIVTGGSSPIVTADELCALGRNLLAPQVVDIVPRPARKPILRAVWKCILRLTAPADQVRCCQCWVQFVVCHFGAQELQVLLDNLLRKLQQDQFDLFHIPLLSILRTIFVHSPDLIALFNMEIFPKFLDIFRSEPVREGAARLILEALVAKYPLGTFADVAMAYQILSICRLLHDSLDICAPSEQILLSEKLICAALDRVDLREDPDQFLSFLVSCRADMANLDSLQHYVIRRVQAFTLGIVRSVRYSISRAAFLQACLANMFISIPSLADLVDRIQLSIQCAQIALAAMAFLHADAFIDFAIDQIGHMGANPSAINPDEMLRLGTYLLATMATTAVIAPLELEEEGVQQQSMDHLDRLLEAILRFPWPNPVPAGGARLDLVRMLVRFLQYLFVLQMQISRRQIEVGNEEKNENDSDHQEHLKWAELSEQIAEHLENELLPAMDQFGSGTGGTADGIFAPGMELLELVAQFEHHRLPIPDPDSPLLLLPPRVRALAKAVYKRCRRRPAFCARIGRLKH